MKNPEIVLEDVKIYEEVDWRKDLQQPEELVAPEIRELQEIREQTAEFVVPKHFNFRKGARFVKDNRAGKKRAEISVTREAREKNLKYLNRQAEKEAFAGL